MHEEISMDFLTTEVTKYKTGCLVNFLPCMAIYIWSWPESLWSDSLTIFYHVYDQGSSAVFILNSTPTQLKTQLSWVIPWVGVLFCILSWVGNVTQLVGSVGGPSQVPWQHALSTAQLPWKRHVTADDTVQNGGVPGGWQFLRYAAIGRLFLTTQEAKVG